MGKQIGLDMKLYRNTGSFAIPVWTLIDNVRDLSATDTRSEAEVSRRASAFKQFEPAQRDFSAEWEMVYDGADANFTALRNAHRDSTLIEFAFADGLIATVGTIFLRIECKVFEFSRSEPLDDANIYSVAVKHAYTANIPAYVVV